ncbi:MAG: DUF309 domain-containing protein [Verrucomicrobia bacterium]|nr:DUF309 domain-containing protein [Verrucomicrobiota bacterium]MBI3866915.1 DUF309 domain-containing protein [Verrucomicrobiota bacterium]
MTHKSAKVAAITASLQGQDLDARYLGYFECFNQGLFYEAHDVLEDLWLEGRGGPDDGFYKGLIQFAGAFVHLQKNRLSPAAALFRLSAKYLQPYAPWRQSLNVGAVLEQGRNWVSFLEAGSYARNPLTDADPPRMTLER